MNAPKYPAELVARIKAAASLVGAKRVARITGIPWTTVRAWINGDARAIAPDPAVSERIKTAILGDYRPQ